MSKKKKNYFLDKVGLYLIAFIVAFGLFTYGCNGGDARKKKAEPPKAKAEVASETPAVVEKDPLPLEGMTPIHEVKPEIPMSPQDIRPASGGNYAIFIDKSKFRLYLYDGTRALAQFPVAIGKNPGQKRAVGDLTTPTGAFYVDEIDDASSWTHDFGDGKGEINGAYGPWFISLHTPGWEGIGIHGTHDPASIGTCASEGCVRMNNKDLLVLKQFVKFRTPVTIKESIDVK